MDTDSFIVYIKIDDIYKDIAENVETRSDTLPKEKNKKCDWINEKRIKWKNHGKICWIKRKNLQLLNR